MNHGDDPAPDPATKPDEMPAILNVNDDDANRFALTRILEGRGFRVGEARTGTEALRLVTETRPDLVVLDVELPDIDGFEVCRRIKANPETAAIPVLHLSARFVLEEDRVHGLTSGADGYLIQPVEPLELIASIRGLLRMRRAEDAARQSARKIEQLESELRALERMGGMPSASAGPGANRRVLREAEPAEFGDLVSRFERLLDLALDQHQYRVRHELTAPLREIGDRLGALGAGPRDVIDLYGTALTSRSAGAPAVKARAYLDEGRLLVLELMGHLVSYYRDPPAGSDRPAPP